MMSAIQSYKETIAVMVPGMDVADSNMVWKAVKDKVDLSICLHTDENEQLLKSLVPDEDIQTAAQVFQTMEDPDDIAEEDRALIDDLFYSLEVAHSELASACNTLSRLLQKLKPQQLMMVQVSVCPLIQVKAATALLEPPASSRRQDLPEDQNKRVKMLMIPDTMAKLLKIEKIKSPTRILAVAWAFRILNTFGKGMTQRNMQESYSMHAKQLATCITGRKYLGGSDRKHKAPVTDEGPSTSKKLATN